MTETLLRLPAVIAAVGYSRSTLYALIKQGKFPAPVRLAGGGAVAWKSSAVQSWIEEQGQPRREKAAA